MLDEFIVVDYQAGAGGEFIARFISAHFGHTLEFDQQQNPSPIQKWLNSHSLINKDWGDRFPVFFQLFLKICKDQNISRLAVPYHLYKWPRHVDHILDQVPHARFVKINCDRYADQVYADFQRKILDRPLKNFTELQFLLTNQPRESIIEKLKSYKLGQLQYRDIVFNSGAELQTLPSNDVEIDYGDFFCNFDQTVKAYEELCAKIKIVPSIVLISALLDRNKKNLQQQQII